MIALAACSLGEGPQLETFCPSEQVAPCDVRDGACQRLVVDYVACLMELPSPAELEVRTETASKSQDQERYRRQLAPLRRALAGISLGPALPPTAPDPPFVELSDDGVISMSGLSSWEDASAMQSLAYGAAWLVADRSFQVRRQIADRRDYDGLLAAQGTTSAIASFYARLLGHALARDSYYDERGEDRSSIAQSLVESPGPLDAIDDAFIDGSARNVVEYDWRVGPSVIEGLLTALPEQTIRLGISGLPEARNRFALEPPPLPTALSGFRFVAQDRLGSAVLSLFLWRRAWWPIGQTASATEDRFYTFHRDDPPADVSVWLVADRTVPVETIDVRGLGVGVLTPGEAYLVVFAPDETSVPALLAWGATFSH